VVDDVFRCDARELGLTHLLAPDQQPAVCENLRRQWLTGREKHRRPVHGVEAQDVFADQMNVRRPCRRVPGGVIGSGFGSVPGRGGVVQQSVEPYVHHLGVVPGKRDSPINTRPRHRNVHQALLEESHHLVVGALRADRFGVGFVVLDEAVSEGRQLEEPVVFPELLHRAGVHRAHLLPFVLTGPVDEVPGELELLASHAVGALVGGGIHETVVANLLPEFLDSRHVSIVGRADEVVVSSIDGLQNRQPGLLDEPVDPRLRGDTAGFGGPLHLGSMLIDAGEVPHLLAALPVPTGENVTGCRRVRVTDMWGVVDVVDGRRDVVRLLTQ